MTPWDFWFFGCATAIIGAATLVYNNSIECERRWATISVVCLMLAVFSGISACADYCSGPGDVHTNADGSSWIEHRCL